MAISSSWLGGAASTSPIFPFRTDKPVSQLLAKMLLLTPTRTLTRCFSRDFADRRFSLTATFLGRSAAHREASRLRVQPWSVMANAAASTVAEPAQGVAPQADQPDKEALLERFLTEQQRAARMEPADEARTLIALGGCECPQRSTGLHTFVCFFHGHTCAQHALASERTSLEYWLVPCHSHQ